MEQQKIEPSAGRTILSLFLLLLVSGVLANIAAIGMAIFWVMLQYWIEVFRIV